MTRHWQTYAQAVGEAPPSGLVFFPGEDFDPGDAEDVATVRLAMDIERADRMRALEEENRQLRLALRQQPDCDCNE